MSESPAQLRKPPGRLHSGFGRIGPVGLSLMMWRAFIFALTIPLLAPVSRADDIVIKNATGLPGRIIDNARIRGIADDQLRYITSSGAERAEDVQRVFQIRVTSDPALTAAEEAFVSGRWDEAIDGYERVVRGMEDWKRRWSAPRLLHAARKGNRFDAAVSAYIAFVRIDASAASSARPDPTGVGVNLIDDAIRELTDALRGATPEQSASFLALKLELQRARGDTAGALRTLDDLLKYADSFEMDASMRRLLADARLAEATAAMEAGQYARAIEVVERAYSAFVEPPTRSRALFLVAEARSRLAEASQDRAQWLDAALAYMRVVASFDEASSGGLRSQSLARVAEIHERLGETETALAIWTDLVENNPQTPAAVLAQQRLGIQP